MTIRTSKIKCQKFNTLIILLFIVFISLTECHSQVYSEADIEICNQKFQLAVKEDLKDRPINQVVLEVGKSFIGTDYLAHALEPEGKEQLVINLSGLDCTTLVENSLALSRCIKKGSASFDNYLAELEYIRYRDGVVSGYLSRLHYFSDWITNNVAKGVVKDETFNLGGVPIKFNLDYMSSHSDDYPQLDENDDLVTLIQIQEQEISERGYLYIPKTDFASKESSIQGGEIIAITTTVEGLDIGHVGIAVKMDDGRIHLLHAPTVDKKVQITEEPLSDYLMKYKRHSGVIVLRVLEPSKIPD